MRLCSRIKLENLNAKYVYMYKNFLDFFHNHGCLYFFFFQRFLFFFSLNIYIFIYTFRFLNFSAINPTLKLMHKYVSQVYPLFPQFINIFQKRQVKHCLSLSFFLSSQTSIDFSFYFFFLVKVIIKVNIMRESQPFRGKNRLNFGHLSAFDGLVHQRVSSRSFCA